MIVKCEDTQEDIKKIIVKKKFWKWKKKQTSQTKTVTTKKQF